MQRVHDKMLGCDNLGQVIVDTPGCQNSTTTAVSDRLNIFHNCLHRKLLKQQSVVTLPEIIGLFLGGVLLLP